MMLLNGFILFLPCWLVRSLREEGLSASSQAQPLVAKQQGSGLTAIDLNVWKKLVDFVNERESRAVLS